MTWSKETIRSIKDGYGGDIYRRKLTGDVAQCGCRWTKDPDWGDVLKLCALHQAHSEVRWRKR